MAHRPSVGRPPEYASASPGLALERCLRVLASENYASGRVP